MIIVDTTVWVDFLNGRGTSFECHLSELIEQAAPIALTDLIYGEILQGIRDDRSHRQTRDLLLAYPIFPIGDLRTIDRAVNIYRACRKKGITVRKTVDCLIAAVCLRVDAELYHNDGDFDAIARVEPLRIHREH